MPLQRGIGFSIVLSYCVLPSVARAVFQTWSCEAFGVDDETRERVSYMRSDLSVTCGGSEHNELVRLSYALLVIWPIGMPCLYLALLLRARDDIRQRRQSFAAASTRFLWVDYEPRYFW